MADDFQVEIDKLVKEWEENWQRERAWRVVELSGQVIGERTLGVWCSHCALPSAEIVDVAVLAKRQGVESFECDPVVDLVTIWGCRDCQTVFQLPESPTLSDNRE